MLELPVPVVDCGVLVCCWPVVGWKRRSIVPELPFPGGMMGCGWVTPGVPGGMGRLITMGLPNASNNVVELLPLDVLLFPLRPVGGMVEKASLPVGCAVLLLPLVVCEVESVGARPERLSPETFEAAAARARSSLVVNNVGSIGTRRPSVVIIWPAGIPSGARLRTCSGLAGESSPFLTMYILPSFITKPSGIVDVATEVVGVVVPVGLMGGGGVTGTGVPGGGLC